MILKRKNYQNLNLSTHLFTLKDKIEVEEGKEIREMLFLFLVAFNLDF